jgi:transposase-like protein
MLGTAEKSNGKCWKGWNYLTRLHRDTEDGLSKQQVERAYSLRKERAPPEEWKRPPREWTEAKTQFAIIFGDRFTF